MATMNPYPFSNLEVHIKQQEGSKIQKPRTKKKGKKTNVEDVVSLPIQFKTMASSSSSAAAFSFPGAGGLISSRDRAAETKLLQLRPSARARNVQNRISSKSFDPVKAAASGGVPLPPLDLTEENIELVLADARVEASQVELSELDGPFVKISLKGRFWHKRSTVVARLGNYLKQRIPEILEVEIEDEKQLDDSPENF
ncbi:putative Core-2/I-branching beta-1,6-N-acetylglucosaminyltransferase family protein [Hibiscus syriacus]|uniref:Core-2/I-branching beta-1,6-N-acetylglucosaminyltransferase family protein n=1 Tax=Hibiscus syriacus TaxID=106335 RepID=A0A6A2Y9F5_HIBSY|nr:putative Core-2/I-branching beta-1,6-N-acetylglucosaminyltransferase family protein [Hibiscus syriacus]